MGVIKLVSFLRQWKQTETPSQSGWKAAAGSRASGEAAKWYKLRKTTLAEPYRLPPPSEWFQQLPSWGFHTWGPRRQKTFRGEKEGDGGGVTDTGEQYTPWTETNELLA